MSSYPLRLPDNLNEQARERAAAIGISFNGFICVAVDAYLRGHPAPGAAFVPDREFEDLVTRAVGPAERPVPKWAVEDPKPVLGSKPTKRERRALAEWHQREEVRKGGADIPDMP